LLVKQRSQRPLNSNLVRAVDSLHVHLHHRRATWLFDPLVQL
jgi:hypothetical protein